MPLLTDLRTLLLLTCVASLWQMSNSKVCQSLDIRNNVLSLRKLTDCTVVEGFVQIVLMVNTNESDFEPYSFPELREITDYLMLFRVKGLQSLGKLFPNLEIIRGHNPWKGNYALVINKVFSLTEIDLHSLREISEGSVIIFKNPTLCYVDTVDWDRITLKPSEANYKALNRPTKNCQQKCPRTCPDKHCWSASYCQVQAKDAACDSKCVGDCHRDGPHGCFACHGVFTPQGECASECPPQTYVFLNRRCVTRSECISTKPSQQPNSKEKKSQLPFNNVTENYVIFEGTCVKNCPPGFEVNSKGIECQRCREGSFKKTCDGAHLTSMQDAQKLRGCTYINGSLQVIIKLENTAAVITELEENLGSIEEINGYLKVSRSSLTDLNFFKNLTTIVGTSPNKSNEHFAFMVSENQNLQELWNWDTKENLTILGGKLFFHYNPKLCLHHINKLIDVLHYDSNYTPLEISMTSNGDKFPCALEKINITVVNKTHDFIQINIPYITNVFWYVLHYTKDHNKTVKMFDDLDECSDYSWRTKDISVDSEDLHLVSQGVLVNMTDLEPYTQYAFYVTTYTINSTGATSDMQYEATHPTTPTELRMVHAFSNSSSTIVLQWEPPEKVNGRLSEYVVTWAHLGEDASYILQRNYCEFPSDYTMEPYEKIGSKPRKKIDLQNCCKNQQNTEVNDVTEFTNQYCSTFSKDYLNSLFPEDFKSPSCESYFHAYLHNYQYPHVQPIFTIDQNNTKFPNNFHQRYSSLLPINSNIEDKDSNDLTYNIVQKRILPANSTDMVIDSLTHFHNYVITIKACRESHPTEINTDEVVRCSKAELVTVRTERRELSDEITGDVQIDVNQRSMSVFWDSPKSPNGLVVAFEIQYQRRDFKTPNPVQVCITFNAYENNKGYFITGMPVGKYEVRIRVISLAGKGPFTLFYPFNVTDERLSSLHLIFIALSVLICICIIYLFLWRLICLKKPYEVVVLADVNPNYHYLTDKYEVERENIEFGDALGVGSFGKVIQGVLKPINIKCAIKTLHDNPSAESREEFLSEATIMKTTSQAHHIVKLLGVVSVGNPPLVLMELMEKGDLKSYLRSERGKQTFGSGAMIHMACQIADAMCFMEAKRLIHRDLAARNCMVSSDLSVKVGDFGMARDIYETDYYRKKNKGLLPIRWMAPESLQDGEFSSQSDVWSFGVVLWEIVSMAEQPYQGSSNDQVLQDVIAGRKLEIPNHCPDPLKRVMVFCWKDKASERYNFMKIMNYLDYYHDREFRKVAFYYSPEATALREARKDYVEMNFTEGPLPEQNV